MFYYASDDESDTYITDTEDILENENENENDNIHIMFRLNTSKLLLHILKMIGFF